MFPAYEPNTVLIANGLAGMVRGRPRSRPSWSTCRSVVTVNGDGGFLMNCQEPRDRRAPQDPDRQRGLGERQYGSIVWKQDKKFGSHFGTDFTNPDFVKLAEMLACRPGAVARPTSSASARATRHPRRAVAGLCCRSTTPST